LDPVFYHVKRPLVVLQDPQKISQKSEQDGEEKRVGNEVGDPGVEFSGRFPETLGARHGRESFPSREDGTSNDPA
jgi:hypothetical protein